MFVCDYTYLGSQRLSSKAGIVSQNTLCEQQQQRQHISSLCAAKANTNSTQ